ncbi:MAG: DUF357 domain-containing protein [Candidatus Aenigmarchaeota archaeon]|nr:DUF357 domain-containing protein [Candidatus Aenigmarchaeota archaeon]
MKEKEKLQKETKKWLAKLEKELPKIESTGKIDKKSTKNAMENIKAYVSDCRHFMEKEDWVNAYEAIIYSWGIYETCLRSGILKKK